MDDTHADRASKANTAPQTSTIPTAAVEGEAASQTAENLNSEGQLTARSGRSRLEVCLFFRNDSQMELEIFTERLRLTPFVADDLDLALEMWTDPDVVKYICDVMTEAEIRQEMPNSTKRGGNGGIGLWCVAYRRTGENLGDSYLLPLPIDLDDTDFSLVVMGQMPDAEI